MATLERETVIAAPRFTVFEFFSDPRNLGRITPRSLGFEIVEAPERRLRDGDRIRYHIRILGLRLPWVSRITEWREGTGFVDEQEHGPYRRWRHEHTLTASDRGVVMRDRVEYQLPFGLLGRLVAGWWVRRNLERIFDYRAEAIGELFG